MQNLEKGEFAFKVITQRLIPDILNYISYIYKVKESTYMKLEQESCYEVSNISNIAYKTIFAHLTLVFTFTDDAKETTLAWAEVCSFSPLSGRPIAGQV